MNEARTSSRDYRIVRVLGEGGMGVVYEAEHAALGRRVALKVLSERSADDPTALARLRREALAMGSLQHPHVVQVSDFSEGPPPFVVMELLSGHSLRDRMRERGPMPPADACLVAVQVLSALGAAHRAGIVHRDVKPANVFVVSTPVTDVFVKLLDFGVAKLLTSHGPALTSVDSIIGSAPYMAPEQIRGETIDGRTDLFALGIMLYEMLAGRRPFVAGTSESVMVAILHGGPIAPLVGVHQALEAVVLRALSQSPSARYQTADEMTAALMPFVPQAGLTAVATSAMVSRAPDTATRTDVDTWLRATSVTPRLAPSSATTTAAATLALTVDQTDAAGDSRGRAVAPPLAHSPATARYASPAMPPLARAPGFHGTSAPAVGSSGRAGMFVGLGVVALLVLGTFGRVAWNVVGAVPGASPALGLRPGPIYGSCMPPGKTSVCTEYISLANPSESRAASKNACTRIEMKWSDAPCSRAGATFGCRGLNATSWFFPPITVDQAKQNCPVGAGAVVMP